MSERSTTGTGTGSFTLTLPSHQTGDLLVLLVSVADSSHGIATPSGYTSRSNAGNGGGQIRLAVFTKTAASAAESNPTISSTGGVTGALQAIAIAVGNGSYSQGAFSGDAGFSAPVSPALGVSTSSGNLVLRVCAIQGTATETLSSGTVIRNVASPNRLVAYWLESTASTEGTATWSDNARWRTATIELTSDTLTQVGQVGAEVLVSGGSADARAAQVGAEVLVSGGSADARAAQVGAEVLVMASTDRFAVVAQLGVEVLLDYTAPQSARPEATLLAFRR